MMLAKMPRLALMLLACGATACGGISETWTSTRGQLVVRAKLRPARHHPVSAARLQVPL